MSPPLGLPVVPPFAAPSRAGVGASCVALPSGSWPLLVDFLTQHFPAVPRDEWLQRLDAGAVLDAGGAPCAADAAYRQHSKIFYYRSVPHEWPIPFQETILFQDAHLIAVDKPHFLPVIPAGRYLQETLLVRLKRRLGIDTLAPMHRIDRETAGLVLFTIEPADRAVYQALFRQRAVTKHYQAIARWRPDQPLPPVLRHRLEAADSFMQMRVVDGTPNAETVVRVLEVAGQWARYGLQPVTGQRHQLRVQMNALGLPLRNDQIYPVHAPELPLAQAPDYSKPLQLLADSIEFIDPLNGQLRRFESRQRLAL